MITSDRLFKIINTVCLAIIIGLLFSAVVNLVSASNYSIQNIDGDMSWSIGLANKVLVDDEYIKVADLPVGPSGYPVPMLLLLHFIGYIPKSILLLVFICFYVVLPVLSFNLLICIFDLKNNNYRWSIALCAFFCVWDYIQFDIRAFNLNIILVFLVILATYSLKNNKDVFAGVLLGASIVIKLYSVFLIPLWIYQKRYKAAISAIIFIFFLFVIFPMAALGFMRSLYLTLDWLEAVRTFSSAQASLLLQVYLVSLSQAVTYSFQAISGITFGAMSPRMWDDLNLFLNIFKGLWIIFVVLIICHLSKKNSQYVLESQTAILLLAPIPISPLLQPHHMVLFLPAVFILCRLCFMKSLNSFLRIILCALCLVVFSEQVFKISQVYRGYLFLFESMLISLALSFIPVKSDQYAGNDCKR